MKHNAATPDGAPKKKSHKVLIVILVLLVIGGIGAAMGGGKSGSAPAKTGQAQDAKTEQQVAEHEYSIDACKTGTNLAGDPVVLVTYTFKNNTDKTATLSTDFKSEVYQNGVECQEDFMTDGTDSLATIGKVKGGATSQFTLAYQVKDNSKVEVDVMDSWLGNTDKPLVSKEFDLQ